MSRKRNASDKKEETEMEMEKKSKRKGGRHIKVQKYQVQALLHGGKTNSHISNETKLYKNKNKKLRQNIIDNIFSVIIYF